MLLDFDCMFGFELGCLVGCWLGFSCCLMFLLILEVGVCILCCFGVV